MDIVSFFAANTWALWLIAVVWAFAILGSLSSSKTPVAFLLFVGGVIGFSFLHLGNPFVWAWENPDLLAKYVGGYLAAGLLVAVIKFIMYINSSDTQQRIRDAHDYWVRHGSNGSFKESSQYPFGFDKDFPRIVFWAFFWPFVLVLNIGGDLLWKAVRFLGVKLSSVFGLMADNAVDRALKNK